MPLTGDLLTLKVTLPHAAHTCAAGSMALTLPVQLRTPSPHVVCPGTFWHGLHPHTQPNLGGFTPSLLHCALAQPDRLWGEASRHVALTAGLQGEWAAAEVQGVEHNARGRHICCVAEHAGHSALDAAGITSAFAARMHDVNWFMHTPCWCTTAAHASYTTLQYHCAVTTILAVHN
jgi:hypothetical protein